MGLCPALANVVTHLSYCGDNMSSKNNFGKERLVWSHSVRVESTVVMKAWQQGPETAGRLFSQEAKEDVSWCSAGLLDEW